MRPSLVAVALFAAMLAVSPAAAQDWDAVEITSQELADGVYMLTGRGGNLGLGIKGSAHGVRGGVRYRPILAWPRWCPEE